MVFAKVGSAGLVAIASISLSSLFIASSAAGAKSATATLSNGGTPPNGPVQGASRGLAACAEAPDDSGRASVAAEADRNVRRCMKTPEIIVAPSALYDKVMMATIWVARDSPADRG